MKRGFKKGSMELGINTVVVLVIAMVIIAGGIAFIRGFFKQGTDKLGGAFNVADFGMEPTSTKPLVLTEGSVSIKTGKDAKVRIGFYNKETGDRIVKIDFGNCVSTAIVDPAQTQCTTPIINSLEQTVKSSSTAGFETYVITKCKTAPAQNLPPGNYICPLKAVSSTDNTVVYAETQITLEVTS